MKTVCIVGAGPAGLVAAKILSQTGQFQPTIYEAKDRLGGIWAIDEDTQDGWLSPTTPTNLSRFTVGFSDLDWNSVDLKSRRARNDSTGMAAPPMFPKAWQVNRYLETYRDKFMLGEMIKFSTRVVKAERIESDESSKQWNITIEKDRGGSEVRTFDYLLLASGFFARPRTFQQDLPVLGEAVSAHRVVHSSQFRDLRDLFPNDEGAAGKDILLLGGGNSSGETAAAVAMQLSNSQWSSSKARRNAYHDCKVIHVTPRPIYALPPFNQYDKESRTYVPLDLKLYDYSKRPPELESYAGRQSKEVMDIGHNSIQTMVGGDQSDLGVALANIENDERGALYVALSESYPEFVRSGEIEVLAGRVTGIEQTASETIQATIQMSTQTTKLDNIGAVIYATGFTPIPAFDFLAEDVKAALQYDPKSMRLPLILNQWQTYNPAVPDLSFLGFYEGPYWPMIEMQARLTAHRWLTGTTAPVQPFEEEHQLLNLRQAMQDRCKNVPQFWFNDYVGYIEDIATHLQLSKDNGLFQEREGCMSPARYRTEDTDVSEANAIMHDLHRVWHNCLDDGKYVARAAFRAMQGRWTINRRIESSDPAFSGTLEGVASFHPRFPTSDKSGNGFDLEYLYIESGTFHSSSGMAMTAKRRYVYRYSEISDELSVWFVKPDDDLAVDYLFHNLQFVRPEEARKAGACIAKADHLCVEDMYWTEYRLPIKGIALHDFEIKHTVKGPHKDYVATTRYSRQLRPRGNGVSRS